MTTLDHFIGKLNEHGAGARRRVRRAAKKRAQYVRPVRFIRYYIWRGCRFLGNLKIGRFERFTGEKVG